MSISTAPPELSLSDVAKGRDRASKAARSIIREAEGLGTLDAQIYALMRTTLDIEMMWGSVRTWATRINVKRRRQFAKLKDMRAQGLQAWLRSMQREEFPELEESSARVQVIHGH